MAAGCILFLAGFALAVNLWQWLAGLRFSFAPRTTTRDLPSLSVLKPLKGIDSQTELCLRSWFEQQYSAGMELLFGVADENDPACALVRKLAPEFPGVRSKLVICDPVLGPNAKVSALCYLAREAAHEHLIISDDDVEARGGLLEQIAVSLVEGAELTSCFYVMRPLNTAMAVESVAVNADFWTHVLQRLAFGRMNFALGAVVGTTRTTLRKIGGFESLLDVLADDYELGNRIASTGGRLELCPVPVTCWSDEQNWAQMWKHQLRWARTIRVCQPGPYFLSILGNATLWSLLAAFVSPTVTLVGLLVRGLTARANYARLTGGDGWIALGLAPVKDLLSALLWVCSFAGNTVTWRGLRFRVSSRGKLTPLA